MSSTLHNAIQLIQNCSFMVLFEKYKKRMCTLSDLIGLPRNLDNDFRALSAKLENQTRQLGKEDAAELLDRKNEPSIKSLFRAKTKSVSIIEYRYQIPTPIVKYTLDTGTSK